MNYQTGYCEYDCHTCGQVCPTGAIAPLSLEDKQLTQIGKAQLIKERCIVHKDLEECGACAEVCPTHAVYTELRDNIPYPELKVEHCLGCGRCEFVCPQWPKAIFVQGSPEHGQSEGMFYPQSFEDMTPMQDNGNEFPF
jgi:formate hydrogenlyase subunit 6/NADH:ubiquinone oxidoreductase subunit I